MARVEAHFIGLIRIGIAQTPLGAPVVRLPLHIHGDVPGVVVKVTLIRRHRFILVQRVSGVDLSSDVQRFYRLNIGEQNMAAQIVVAFTIAVLHVQVLALPQNIAAGDMVNILPAVGLEAFLIRRVTIHRAFDVRAAQREGTVVHRAGPAQVGGWREAGRVGDDAKVFHRLPAPAGVQMSVRQAILQLDIALTKFGKAFSVAFVISAAVVIEYAAGVKVIAGAELYRPVVCGIKANNIGKIAGLIIDGDALTPGIMDFLWLGLFFLKIFPVVFKRQIHMGLAE